MLNHIYGDIPNYSTQDLSMSYVRLDNTVQRMVECVDETLDRNPNQTQNGKQGWKLKWRQLDQVSQ